MQPISEHSAPLPAEPLRRIRDTTQPADGAQIGAAVAEWDSESNGRVEARRFAIDPPLPPGALGPAQMQQLELDCLAGSDSETLVLVPTTVAAAATVLFAAALGGGAYTSGLGGAYSRLFTWRSLGGLAGVRPAAPFDSVVEQAQACAWWQFDAPTPWFNHVAWDVGLVALHASGNSLAVLAASDTD